MEVQRLPKSKLYNFLKYSKGVRKPSDFLGRWFSFHSTSAIYSSEYRSRSEEVLPGEAIHILISASFPGVIGRCEEELDAQSAYNVLMSGKFFSVVSRYRVYHVFIWFERIYCHLSQGTCFFPLKLSDEHDLLASVIYRHHDAFAVLADDGVYLKVPEAQQKLMERMDSLSEHILDYEKAGNNVYTRFQARRLDKYLYRKSRQAAGRIGIADTKKAARNRATYEQKMKEKG